MDLLLTIRIKETDSLTGVEQYSTGTVTLTEDDLLDLVRNKLGNPFRKVTDVIDGEVLIPDPTLTEDEMDYYNYSEALKED